MKITYDYSDFNPEGFAFPSGGFYEMQIVAQEEGKTKAGDFKIIFTFQISNGEQKGQQFKIDYNTGHNNLQTKKIALENIARIYYGATGEKPGRNGLNTADLMNKSFGASLVVEKKAFVRDDGTEHNYKTAKLSGIQHLANTKAAPKDAAPASVETKAPW